MAIDHVGMLFFPEQLLLRVIGRVSFPLFAFLIAEGFEKTSNARNYLFRLLTFAAFSQVPYVLFIQAAGVQYIRLNIFFTLAAGLCILILLKRCSHWFSIPSAAGILLMAYYLPFDYGPYGVLMILASGLLLRFRSVGLFALFLLHIAETLLSFFTGVLSLQLFAMMSIPLLMRYNGEHGQPLPRRLLYWFYPAHLLLLWLIWYALTHIRP
ncbi:MAG: TraX protein [Parcubacteria group bacterium GW2011_GWA2_49_9]|nr:MAG: TraX protein [Parcubacteria group bacterium GW2011_GWA2_49_9]